MKITRFLILALVLLLSAGLVVTALAGADSASARAQSLAPPGPKAPRLHVRPAEAGESEPNGDGPYDRIATPADTAVFIACSQPPGVPIPDNNPTGTFGTINTPLIGSILDLDVYISATHTWVGDLEFTLENVGSGVSATIFDRPGVPASTFGCSGNNILAFIDDEAATNVEDECAAATPTIDGSFIGGDPPDPTLLTAFDGLPFDGSWNLHVADLAGGDTGTLDFWCLDAEVVAIQVEKTVGTNPNICSPTDTIQIPAGTDVTYCFQMTNIGDITVTNHTVVDDQLGTLLGPGFVAEIPPFSSAFFTVTANITQPTVNEATWTVDGVSGGTTSASDRAWAFVDNSCDFPGNPVENCSFETGDFTGWLPTDLPMPFYPLTVTTAGVSPWFGFFQSAPPDGNFTMVNGFDGITGTIQLAQDIFLPPGSTMLEFDYRAAWDMTFVPTVNQDRMFDVNIEPPGGGPPLQATTILTAPAFTLMNDTGNLHGMVDVSAFANSPVRINFVWVIPQSFTGPAFFQLDNVFVEVVPAALDLVPGSISATQGPNMLTQHNLQISNLGAAPLHWEILEDATVLRVPGGVPDALPARPAQANTDPGSAAETVDSAGETQSAPAGTQRAPEASYAPTVGLLYDNGPLVNAPGGGFGGADASVLQNASLGMNVYGYGHQWAADNRIADDFTVTDPEGWAIGEIVYYAYQTGSPLTSTFNHVNYRIWDGPPDDPASSVIFGNLGTNRLLATNWSGIYRSIDTFITSTLRPIMANNTSAGIYLPAGTYWLDWQSHGEPGFSGPWAPPVTISGVITTGNGLQSLDNGMNWAPVVDIGQQGFPFQIYGCVPEDIPWASTDPINGTVPGGLSQDVTVWLDSTGLSPGAYTGNLCMVHNDPMQPLVEIPLNLTVENWMLYLPNTPRVSTP